jgi:hypothetical protein
MRRRNHTSRIAFTLVGLVLCARAEAVEPTVHIWAQSNATNLATTPSTSINGWTFYAVNNAFHARNTADGSFLAQPYPTGGPIDSFPTPVQLKDGSWYVFVVSEDGKVYKFDVQKSINNPGLAMQVAVTGINTQIRDLKRNSSASCIQKDQLQATPTVQIAQYSNGSYSVGKDIVIVPTYHGCGSTSTNKIYALDASDITLPPVWIFNDDNSYQVDYFSEGCSLDYGRNRVYCGSNLEPGLFQNTVWALDTNTGNPVWAVNANAVVNRPQLSFATAPEHLYVTDYYGRVHALRPTDGVEEWAFSLTGLPATRVTQNQWSEFRHGFDHTLFITDAGGTLYTVYDGGSGSSDGEILWQHSFGASPKITSLGSISPTLGKVFVGLDNGTVHQLAIGNGADEGYKVISGAAITPGSTVTDPTLYLQGAVSDINRMVASTWGTGGAWTKSFTVPFASANGQTTTMPCTLANNPADTDLPNVIDKCQNGFNIPNACVGTACCSVGRCVQDPAQSAGNGYCYSAATSPNSPTHPNGWKVNTCDDGEASCTTNKVCVAGTCHGDWNPSCTGQGNCNLDPRACGPGNVCTQGITGGSVCVGVDGAGAGSRQDFNVYNPCGSMARTCANVATGQPSGATWGGERDCIKGVCRRARSIGGIANYCSIPTDLEMQTMVDQGGNKAATYATSVAFSRLPQNGKPNTAGTCQAFMPSFQAGNERAANGITMPTQTLGSCNVCGVLYQCIGPTAGVACADGVTATTVVSNPFTDPTGGAALVTRMRVAIRGEAEACGVAGTADIWFRNQTTLNWTFLGTAQANTSICSCNACDNQELLVDYTNLAGVPNYNYSSGQMILWVGNVTNTRIDVSLADVHVYTGPRNTLRRVVHGMSTADSYLPNFVPAYLNGVAVAETANGAAVSDVFMPAINDSTDNFAPNIARWDNSSQVVDANPGPGPAATNRLATEKYFTTSDSFNYGPVGPSAEGIALSSGGRMFFGNYLNNGDLYSVTASFTGLGYTATSLLTLPAGGRIATLDYPAPVIPTGGGASLGDQQLRVVRRNSTTTHLELLYVDLAPGAAGGPTVVYTLDLSTIAEPGATTGGISALFGATSPIASVQSVTVDPLNGTNATYLEVTDNAGKHYVLQVTADHAVRPLADYGTKIGVIRQMDNTYTPPPTDFGNEGRITAGAQEKLVRIVPADPTGATSQSIIKSYDLAP